MCGLVVCAFTKSSVPYFRTLTAGVLKRDPNAKKKRRLNAIYYGTTYRFERRCHGQHTVSVQACRLLSSLVLFLRLYVSLTCVIPTILLRRVKFTLVVQAGRTERVKFTLVQAVRIERVKFTLVQAGRIELNLHWWCKQDG